MPMRLLSVRALLGPAFAIMVLAAPQAALADPDEWGRERAEHRDDREDWRRGFRDDREAWRREFRDDRDDWMDRREEWRESREEWRESRDEWMDRRDDWRDHRGEWRDDRSRGHGWNHRDRFDRRALGGFGRDDRQGFGRHGGGGHAFGFPPRRQFGHGFPPRRGHGFHGGPPWSR